MIINNYLKKKNNSQTHYSVVYLIFLSHLILLHFCGSKILQETLAQQFSRVMYMSPRGHICIRYAR